MGYSEALKMNDTQIPTQHPFSAGKQQPVLPPVSPKRDRYKREGLKSILSTIVILLLAPILALLITAFVFQSYEVDGPSMESTLNTRDRLIIWKVGRTWSRITRQPYIPPRGTVVVFVMRGQYEFSSDREKQLIKRIIGLPGERVVVKDGVVTVYNEDFPEGMNPDETMDYGPQLKGETIGNVDITVRENEVFVMGDHRDNSLDSRTFGSVPASDIVGTLTARILPISEAKKF